MIITYYGLVFSNIEIQRRADYEPWLVSHVGQLEYENFLLSLSLP